MLRPITVADTELDYTAVMESREYLRPWEQTGWSADDFSLEEDRANVAMLEERHTAGRAFTYTVLDPAGTECLGCVYVMPPDARSFTDAQIAPVDDESWADYSAALYFWVRTSRLASGFDARLLDAVREWWAREWSLGPLLLVTNEQVAQQVETIERAGLRMRFTIRNEGQSGAYLAYA